MLGAILGAVSTVEGLVKGGGGLSARDQVRVNMANSALTKALQGDASSLAYMIQQSNNSATQVGKDAFRAALQQYYNQQSGVIPSGSSPTVSTQYVSQPSPAQLVIADTVGKVRQDIAGGVQTLGAGATTSAANGISGTNSAFTLPTNTRTIAIVGLAAVGAFLVLRKHK